MDMKAMGVGGLIMVAVGLIFGAIVLQASSQNVGNVVNTVTLSNASLLTSVVNNTDQYFTDYRSVTATEVRNATNGTAGFVGGLVTEEGNWSITNNVIDPTTGGLAVKFTPLMEDANIEGNYSSAWVITGTAQPTTYDASSGGRAMANLIVILMALALAVYAITQAVRNKG